MAELDLDIFAYLFPTVALDELLPFDQEKKDSGLGFSGPRLLLLRGRPEPDPVSIGIPTPGHFNQTVGVPFGGKSTKAICTAMARAAGVAAWDGAPVRAPGRVGIAVKLRRGLNSLNIASSAGLSNAVGRQQEAMFREFNSRLGR